MPLDPAAICFVPVREDDRPLLRRWLNMPHVRQWWGDPQEELAAIYDTAGEHAPFIASIRGQPVAYVQYWRPAKHPDLPWQYGMTATTCGIDIAIGEDTNLGRGLGSAIVRKFAAQLFIEGATRLVIDPDITNLRAIAAYRKAGFQAYSTYTTDEGTDLLMELFPADFERAT